MSRERVEGVLRGYELFNEGNAEEALDGFDEEIEWIAPAILPDTGPFNGHEGVLRFWQLWVDDFSEFRVELQEVHDLDEHVVVMARVRAVGRDSGAEVTTPTFPHVWTWRGDKVIRMEMFPTTPAASAAIGKDWS